MFFIHIFMIYNHLLSCDTSRETMATPTPVQPNEEKNLGITFADIRSDEPHQTVTQKRLESHEPLMKGNHPGTTRLHEQGIFDVERAYSGDSRDEGTVISDKRRASPTISESFKGVFREWFGGNQENIENAPRVSLDKPTIALPKIGVPLPISYDVTQLDSKPLNIDLIPVEKMRTLHLDVERLQHPTTQTVPVPPSSTHKGVHNQIHETLINPSESVIPVGDKIPSREVTHEDITIPAALDSHVSLADAVQDSVTEKVTSPVIPAQHTVPEKIKPAPMPASGGRITTPTIAPQVAPIATEIPTTPHWVSETEPKEVPLVPRSNQRGQVFIAPAVAPIPSELPKPIALDTTPTSIDVPQKVSPSSTVDRVSPAPTIAHEPPHLPQRTVIHEPLIVVPRTKESRSESISPTPVTERKTELEIPTVVEQPAQVIEAPLPIPEVIPEVPAPRFKSTFHDGKVPGLPTTELPTTPATISETSEIPSTRNERMTLIIVGVLLLLTCIGGGVYYFMHREMTVSQEPIPQEGAVPLPQPFFSVDQREVIAGTDVRGSLTDVALKLSTQEKDIVHYVVMHGNGINTELTTQEILYGMNVNAESSLINAFDARFMLGGIKTTTVQPFIILKTGHFDSVFIGMLSWEKTLTADLQNLFGTAPKNTRTRDGVVRNKPIRSIENESGTIYLVYSFIDQHTIVIAKSKEALEKIIDAF